MTKIRPVLFCMLMASPFFGFSQATESILPLLSSGQISGSTNRQAVFTVHRLADQVEPQKKQTYVALIEGQLASQPSPTPRQPQYLWPY